MRGGSETEKLSVFTAHHTEAHKCTIEVMKYGSTELNLRYN